MTMTDVIANALREIALTPQVLGTVDRSVIEAYEASAIAARYAAIFDRLVAYNRMRLAVVTSHPIQYYAPIFRMLDGRLDLEVFYANRPTPVDQAKAGFGTAFEWDIDLLSGYRSHFMRNVAKEPTTAKFFGCDTPEVAQHIRNGKFDAVLVLGWYLKTFFQAIAAAKQAGIPVFVRGDSQLKLSSNVAKNLFKRLIYPHALRVFNAALYVGQRSREYFESYGYPRSRLFFSPHCVDGQWFKQHGSTQAGAALREREGIGKRRPSSSSPAN